MQAGPQADQLFATLTGMLSAGDPVRRISAYDCEFTGRVGAASACQKHPAGQPCHCMGAPHRAVLQAQQRCTPARWRWQRWHDRGPLRIHGVGVSLSTSKNRSVSLSKLYYCPQAFDSLLLLPKLCALELGPIGWSVEAGHLGMLLGSLRHLTSLDLDFEWCGSRKTIDQAYINSSCKAACVSSSCCAPSSAWTWTGLRVARIKRKSALL